MKKLITALIAVGFLSGSAFAADNAGIAEAQQEIWRTQQGKPAKKANQAKKAKKAKADAPEAAKPAPASAAQAK